MVRQSTGAGLTAGKALCTVFSTVRRLSAIHLRGADGLQGRERPIGVEGGHRFLPPSTPACPAYACRQVEAHRWIAELQGYGSSLMENEIHLLRRPAIDSRRNMVAAPDGNDSFTGHSGHCSVRLQDMEACLMIFIIRSVKIGNGAD